MVRQSTNYAVIWIVFIDNIGRNSLSNTEKGSDIIIFVATAVCVICQIKHGLITRAGGIFSSNASGCFSTRCQSWSRSLRSRWM